MIMTVGMVGPVGFLGLGVMGQPMALRLARAGVDLVVWNRTPSRCGPVVDAGGRAVATAAEVCADSRVVIAMLYDEAATDEVLGRRGPGFAGLVENRLLIMMGTNSPDYSRSLERDVVAVGGRYVEAPVSGSRAAAELGDLVAMVAGSDPAALATADQLLAPVARRVVRCGEVPAALTTKVTVNSFMITMLTGLAEATHLADRHGVDRQVLAEVLLAGTLSSPVLATKLAKLESEDEDAQAAIADVAKNTRLITSSAALAGAAAPLAQVCDELFAEAVELGHGRADLMGVIRAIEARAGA